MNAQIQQIEVESKQIEEMASALLGNNLVELDNYLTIVRNCFLEQKELLDDDLNKIILQIPIYMYNVIVFAQQLEMRKGYSAEKAKYSKNEALLNATGTVQEKTSRAENATFEDKVAELAYKMASSIVQKKLDGAMTILDAAKKVQAQRIKEKALTGMAANAVGAF